MKRYYVYTMGCQMNVHDSEKMSGILRAEGYAQTDDPQNADVIIFNTCSIRQKAEQKFFSELGRLKPLKNKRPDLKIAVAGCIAQQEGRKILRRAPHVDFVFGPQNIHVVRDIARSSSNFVAIEDNPLIANIASPVERHDTLKAWVNVMYGCNNFCTYCIVPYTRGREKSRASNDIISEIKDLTSKGYKEVTLLGQNVNSYKSSLDFPSLLEEINKIKGIERIRFVTSHPKDLSDELILSIKKLEKVCEHIHLPLQSGSTEVLQKMNRKYTYDEYVRRVGKLREAIPDISITSDIIAGFPHESDEDHRCTVAALKAMQFDGIYAFKYSPRPGTKAATMDGQIQDEIRSKRLYEILEVQELITESKNSKLSGTIQEVLVEGAHDDKSMGLLTGRTRTNKIVNFPFHHDAVPGATVLIMITKANRHSLEGEILNKAHENSCSNSRM